MWNAVYQEGPSHLVAKVLLGAGHISDFQKEGRCSQDGGIGRHTLSPHKTKRTTTNLKTKNNQNCQKIELYESLTTKELKKQHSSRPVGGVEAGSQGGEDSRQGCSWQSGQSHICVQINREEQLGSQTGCTTQGSIQQREIKPQILWMKKPVGVTVVGEHPVSQASSLERPTGSSNVHKPTHTGIRSRRAQFACW